MNTQKLVTFLHTNNKIAERSRKKSLQLHKKNKIPNNKFNQRHENLYSGNHKTPVKDIDDDTNKKISHTHGLEEYL